MCSCAAFIASSLLLKNKVFLLDSTALAIDSISASVLPWAFNPSIACWLN